MAKRKLSKISESDQIRSNLWTDAETNVYKDNESLFLSHLMEQYKIYVEMADRISSRRNLANGFFLTLHTFILTSLGLAGEKLSAPLPTIVLILAFSITFILCLGWWWLIRSYKNLNSAKYKVIGHLEEKLPASPYYRAEWIALGEGKDIKKYLPLTIIEQWVPIAFLLIYLTIVVYLGLYQ